MRTVYVVSEGDMPEWKAICKAFAEREGAELLFVNDHSFGISYPTGELKHIYVDELQEILER